jgi:hypothetical protein
MLLAGPVHQVLGQYKRLVERRAVVGRRIACLSDALSPFAGDFRCIWGYLKHHAMPNYCARDLGDVAHRARSNLRSMQRRVTLVRAFWKQAEMF